jgi:two-component system cell cycle sensor histidine kinase/response regulator CckA
MMATRSLFRVDLGLPPGAWRWVAGVFVLAALAAGALAVATPDAARWAGVALLGGIGAVASIFLYAIWPRESLSTQDARRIAEAAARANVAWAITSSDGAVLECNDVYRRMTGVAPTEAPPPPELALAGEPSSAVLYRLTRSAAEKQAREESFRVAPGLEIVAAVRPMGQGQTAWWFTPRLGDSTAQAQGLPVKALALNDIVRDAPIGVAMASADGKLIETNIAFGKFFGAMGLLGGRDVTMLARPGDGAAIKQYIAAAAKGEHRGSVEIHPASQAERTAELYASAAGGDRAILYLIDVTEEKQLELKFAQSQKMQTVGQLAGGIAHDFNNLLTVITGNCDLLKTRHRPGDPSFIEVNEISNASVRAANLVGQLLAFSRQQTLQPKVAQLSDSLGDFVHSLKRLIPENVTLKTQFADNLWLVYADAHQVTNAIMNLVVNARDAMPGGGVVTIRTANDVVSETRKLGTADMPPGDYVRVEVSDTGTGIAKEYLDRIFEPFFTTKDIGKGTGLGLSTVFGIVKQTNGFITVDSEVGRGTSFVIHLPRYHGEAPQAEKIVLRDVTGQDTILLVDDEDGVRRIAARGLENRGYKVLQAPGGEEALEIMEEAKAPIHMLITDVKMAGMDGPTLAREVRKRRPDMPILFISGFIGDVFRENEERPEDVHFLTKPFNLSQLTAKVKDVLSSPPPGKPH